MSYKNMENSKNTTKNEHDRIRLNLVVNHQVKARIERLQALSEGASLTEVIRRALVLYDELLTIRQEGGRFVIENGDAREVLRIL